MTKTHNADEAANRKLDAEWSKAASEGNLKGSLDRVMTFYAKDGSLVWPDQPVAKGHKAIRASWNEQFKDPKLHRAHPHRNRRRHGFRFRPGAFRTGCQTQGRQEHREISRGLET